MCQAPINVSFVTRIKVSTTSFDFPEDHKGHLYDVIVEFHVGYVIGAYRVGGCRMQANGRVTSVPGTVISITIKTVL